MHIFFFFYLNFQFIQWAHFSVISFQCPSEYHEEMGINVEFSHVNPKFPPTKKVLVNLHRNVIMCIYRKKCTLLLKETNLKIWLYTEMPLISICPSFLYVLCSCVCVFFQVISAVQRHNQTQVQWPILLKQAFHLEDVAKSRSSPLRHFTHSFPLAHQGWIRRFIYTPTIGEFRQCGNLKFTGRLITFTQLSTK